MQMHFQFKSFYFYSSEIVALKAHSAKSIYEATLTFFLLYVLINFCHKDFCVHSESYFSFSCILDMYILPT